MVITGRGRHSRDGQGVLGDVIRTHATRRGARVESVRNNPGALLIKMRR